MVANAWVVLGNISVCQRSLAVGCMGVGFCMEDSLEALSCFLGLGNRERRENFGVVVCQIWFCRAVTHRFAPSPSIRDRELFLAVSWRVGSLMSDSRAWRIWVGDVLDASPRLVAMPASCRCWLAARWFSAVTRMIRGKPK